MGIITKVIKFGKAAAAIVSLVYHGSLLIYSTSKTLAAVKELRKL